MGMSEFERRLWAFGAQLHKTLGDAFRVSGRHGEWIESNEEAEALGYRLWGTFIASLCGELEERCGRNFSSFIDQLTERPTKESSKYWFCDMPKTSSPKGRAKVMWAIRNAYVHGNGHYSRINDAEVAAWLQPSVAAKHFRGVKIENDRVVVTKDVPHVAIKTALEIVDKFGAASE